MSIGLLECAQKSMIINSKIFFHNHWYSFSGKWLQV